GLTIRNFELRYHLLDNQLTIENLTGQTLGGSFSQQGRVDLRRKGLAYQSKTTLRGLQADPLVSALLPAAAGTLFGQLDLNLDLNGQGTLSDSLRQNLSGNGSIKLADGRLSGNQLTRDLAAFLQLDELRELVFRQVDGRIQLDRGRVKIDSVFDSSRLRMKPQGQVGLDGSLDLTLGASLAPELMQKLDRKGSFSRLLTGADGWGQLPLKLSGSYSAPRFALDSRALGQQAGQQLQQQLLQKLLPPQPSETTATASDATAPPAENPPPAEQQPANLLDQAVRGLFQRQ
ncbi:MAG: AsmA-like C-terminal region-containing protein, partial [Desulfuromonas thiophila]|nr:AsmA-like C-terminal region-containing protein [Desulfuromonas thiophila]